MKGVSFWLGCALLVQAETLPSQIAVSANDGKYVPADAPDTPRTADTISILRIDRGQAKVLATLHAPATLTGPPGSVAISPDGRLAIVTAGQVLGESGASVAGDIVTVIDLRRPREPRIVQTLHAGTNAAGVAINPAGTLALVANSGADSISAFTIAGGRLSAAGTIVLDPKSRPVDVQFVDGGTAYVVAQGANSLFRLAIDGAGVRLVTGGIAVGAQPYSLAINRRTHMAYVGNIGGRSPAPTPGPRPGSVSIVDLTTGRMVGQVDTGLTPEHVGLSPSGRYLEVTVQNGSNANPASAVFHDYGLMTIYRTDGAELAPAAEARTGRWCQGAVWSTDEKLVLLQCSLLRQIELYRFDGRTLKAQPSDVVALDARPGAIATARSR